LANSQDNSGYDAYRANVDNLKNSGGVGGAGFRQVLFSSFAKKFNRRNKQADRAFIVTDTNIYKLEGIKKKFRDMQRSIAIKEVGNDPFQSFRASIRKISFIS